MKFSKVVPDGGREVPTEIEYRRSALMHRDRFYKLPREVECFIQRANRELPTWWSAEPWTLNRAVTIMFRGAPVLHVTYEPLMDGGLVEQLDMVVDFAKAAGRYEGRVL